ncbi:hypothetical protein GWQ44_04750 [Pseudomonas sp. 3MA1]|uniref:hypothetical protein n=1 Tax=Pseudomonas sp. 3MA1 TaxID=2699196 RepID=UPI0023DDE743|nr:hypothetical protein [Pseudomonas sp. 3MA1]MDF2394834.1 hypothetical protein [Pseudomonas sp. 3MA1]
MDIRAAIVEANTINIVQFGIHAILKMQPEVEEFCQNECIRLVEEALRLGSTKASKHPLLNELPLWQYICAMACENEFYQALERTAP